MSIASEITRLQTAKADLKTAIEGKGVTVPASAKLDAYPALVESIQAGGGGDGDNWYLVAGQLGILFQYTKTNDTTWSSVNALSINLYGGGVYFLYKGEKYYLADVTDGTFPLSKTGQPVANPTDINGFGRATVTLGGDGNYSAYFRYD